ncbi:MAG: type II toxin-antitoxin system VapC family toxin [Candidatus Hydrogenedentes bacterium]|nr:type II toxin-antitoxin system VapC family toxin [Candidatus Hydrogenedentota bacterium]
MPVMVDSCVYLDVFSKDVTWYEWSAGALDAAISSGTVVLNAVIYAEISIRFDRIEELEDELDGEVFEFQDIPREAAFLAGKCFAKYRQRGGQKRLPLPDFFIGAHALVAGILLVTRDARRFREYFPGLALTCP